MTPPSNDNPLPKRSHPAHGVRFVSGAPTIIYLTVCTKRRAPWLATPEVHDLLVQTWQGATAWIVGRYVVMPDHVHLFAAPGTPELPLDNWVRFWKSRFTKSHRDATHEWHVDHWDRRLRNDDSYEEKWNYVRNNPVRHGLVARAEDWPFQGELNPQRW
jgi:REP element-mobilizing transposase RayT